MTRAAIFDEVRKIARPGIFNDPGNVHALDNLLDAFGVPVDRPAQWSISKTGLDLIKQFEGLRLKAYDDGVGVPTIGYGHIKGVRMGDVITEAKADAFLVEDVKEAEAAVRSLCDVKTQGQMDALTSFTFNLGTKSLKDSTLRRLHNDGNYAAAKDQFSKWVFGGGKVMAGLVKRRAAEAKVYAS